ncbi:MAG: PilZ domain-containing protein [Planctomycetota bacterium]
MEQRKYKRFKANLLVGVKTLGTAKDMNNTLKATNISLGGIFLSTPYPFPKDTILELTLKLPGMEDTLKWKGIVRWVSNEPDNPGNGIEFIEFGHLNKEKLSQYIANEYVRDIVNMCENNKNYKNFLMLWNQYKNSKEFELSALLKFFNISKKEFDEIINYFYNLRMVDISNNKVKFISPSELPLLDEYIKKIEPKGSK